MSGYLNHFVEYVLNLFKKENPARKRSLTAQDSPPRRSNSVIENRKIKEEIAKHANKIVWAAGDGKQNKQKPGPVADSCCPNKPLLTPLAFNKFFGQGDAESRGSYDSDDRKRNDIKNIDHDCCLCHDGCSKDFQHFLTCQRPSNIREPSFGLRRSCSLDLRPPYLEDKSWTTGRKKCPMRPSTAPEDGIYEIYRTLEPLRDCPAYRKLIDPVHKPEPERNRPKPSRIPVYTKKHWESGPSKEYVRIPCECGKDSISNPSNRAWRMEGHAIYCPKATIAYRCYLNNKLESLFRIISKRQYCGNIIDSSSHARWMRMAGIYQDEDASYFKKFAKNRMVLPISEYKSALQKMCEECNMDYWEVLRRMTSVEIGTSGVLMRQITRQFILWYGLFETFVFTGNIFGWTALHYMLRQEGIYEHVCDSKDNETHANETKSSAINLRGYRTCEAQDSILNLAYTIGSFCMGSTSFVWGFLLDKWGLRNVRLIINGLITSGCILLSLTIRETSFLLFPSLILLCIAGVPLRLANMQIADLFPERRSTVITLYSGAFSASASVFVFIKYGFDAGLPWEWACFLLVVLSALMLPVTLFVLPADRFGQEKGGLFTGKEKEVSSVAPCVWGTYTYIGDGPNFHRSATMEKKEANGKPAKNATAKENVEEKEEIPLRHSLLSVSYMLHQYWFCWILLYTIIYVGTLHLWSERTTTDRNEDALFSEIYGIFQVSGLFLAPIGGIFMDWSIRRVSKGEQLNPGDHMVKVLRSCFWPMFLTTLLEVVAQACKFFNVQSAIYVSIVAVTLLRAFFISIGTAYLRIRFPAEHFNRLLGIMSTVSAVASLLQFPLFLWEASSLQNVLYVNIFDSACLALAMIHPLLLVVTPIQKYFLKEKNTS